jgi:hypothetical protein
MTITDHTTNLHVPWQSTWFLQSTQLVDRHGVIELAGPKEEAKLGGKARLCPQVAKTPKQPTPKVPYSVS